MSWVLLIVGVLLVWLAVDIVRLQSARLRLPRPVQDELLFGKRPVSEAERAFVHRRLYYGTSSWRFLVVALAAVGLGLLALGVSGL
jgi:hypothetical protein